MGIPEYCPILRGSCIKQDLPLRKYSWPLTCKFCYVTEKRSLIPHIENIPCTWKKAPKFASIFIAILLYSLFINT